MQHNVDSKGKGYSVHRTSEEKFFVYQIWSNDKDIFCEYMQYSLLITVYRDTLHAIECRD